MRAWSSGFGDRRELPARVHGERRAAPVRRDDGPRGARGVAVDVGVAAVGVLHAHEPAFGVVAELAQLGSEQAVERAQVPAARVEDPDLAPVLGRDGGVTERHLREDRLDAAEALLVGEVGASVAAHPEGTGTGQLAAADRPFQVGDVGGPELRQLPLPYPITRTTIPSGRMRTTPYPFSQALVRVDPALAIDGRGR